MNEFPIFYNDECTYNAQYNGWMRYVNVSNQLDSSVVFRLASMQLDENSIYDRGKNRDFFIDVLGPSQLIFCSSHNSKG